ncbi:MAG: hypothetical protein Q7S20_03330 [Gemmatimonadaceae bacterium]|nr:hypothetical protein [Gemmatimonadaceae bacterium]
MNRTTAQFTRLAILLLATAVACKSADKTSNASTDQARADSAHKAAGVTTGSAQPQPELSAEAKVALDSGNVLYRSGSDLDRKKASADAKRAYAAALTQYRLAAERSPKHAAPFFGIYMTARALGNIVLADSALAGIRERGGELPPGAMHSGEPAPAPAAANAPAKAPSKGL